MTQAPSSTHKISWIWLASVSSLCSRHAILIAVIGAIHFIWPAHLIYWNRPIKKQSMWTYMNIYIYILYSILYSPSCAWLPRITVVFIRISRVVTLLLWTCEFCRSFRSKCSTISLRKSAKAESCSKMEYSAFKDPPETHLKRHTQSFVYINHQCWYDHPAHTKDAQRTFISTSPEVAWGLKVTTFKNLRQYIQ